MGQGPFGIMSQPSKILSYLLLVALITSTADGTFQCTSSSADATLCPGGRIVTDEIAQDDMMPLDYPTAEELCACLGKEVLLKNLAFILQHAFADEQLIVLKEKLDKIYPDGYPEEVLLNLGGITAFIKPEDVQKWKFSSSKTLTSLLANALSPELATAIMNQYIASGGPLNAEALKAIGPENICHLKIDENAIRGAEPLNISSCNQATKDILYLQAKRAFSDRHNPPQYYDLIKPYLEGAPGNDLRALSKDNVNMDIDTFMKLRKDAILELTPSEVKGLLGRNLMGLKGQENNPTIKDWIARQKQSELDKLELGFTGGTPEGYVNISPRKNRPPETSGATGSLTLHLFPSLLLTLLLTAFLS